MECAQTMGIGRPAWVGLRREAGFGVARARLDGGGVGWGDACEACVGGGAGFVAGGPSLGDGCPCLYGACRSFVRVSASCCGPSTSDVPARTSLVDGCAHDLDARTYDHDSFGSNVGAST